jgi:hypothetical protein
MAEFEFGTILYTSGPGCTEISYSVEGQNCKKTHQIINLAKLDLAKLCMSSDSFSCLIFAVRYPKTNNNVLIVLDLPEPFRPLMDEKY